MKGVSIKANKLKLSHKKSDILFKSTVILHELLKKDEFTSILLTRRIVYYINRLDIQTYINKC